MIQDVIGQGEESDREEETEYSENALPPHEEDEENQI